MTTPRISDQLPHAAIRLAQRFGFTDDPYGELKQVERAIIEGRSLRRSMPGEPGPASSKAYHYVHHRGRFVVVVWDKAQQMAITVMTMDMMNRPYTDKKRNRKGK